MSKKISYKNVDQIIFREFIWAIWRKILINIIHSITFFILGWFRHVRIGRDSSWAGRDLLPCRSHRRRLSRSRPPQTKRRQPIGQESKKILQRSYSQAFQRRGYFSTVGCSEHFAKAVAVVAGADSAYIRRTGQQGRCMKKQSSNSLRKFKTDNGFWIENVKF